MPVFLRTTEAVLSINDSYTTIEGLSLVNLPDYYFLTSVHFDCPSDLNKLNFRILSSSFRVAQGFAWKCLSKKRRKRQTRQSCWESLHPAAAHSTISCEELANHVNLAAVKTLTEIIPPSLEGLTGGSVGSQQLCSHCNTHHRLSEGNNWFSRLVVLKVAPSVTPSLVAPLLLSASLLHRVGETKSSEMQWTDAEGQRF